MAMECEVEGCSSPAFEGKTRCVEHLPGTFDSFYKEAPTVEEVRPQSLAHLVSGLGLDAEEEFNAE